MGTTRSLVSLAHSQHTPIICTRRTGLLRNRMAQLPGETNAQAPYMGNGVVTQILITFREREIVTHLTYLACT